MMLATTSHILPLTTIRRQRLLPVTGRVVARVDQKVGPLDVVAEAHLGREHALIDVARMLGVSAEQADGLIQCKPGERLEAGQTVARSNGLVPFPARVPKEGRVVAVGGGKILMETSGGNYELKAGIPGTVAQVIPERGVEIVAHGALIQGAWGNGRVDQGLMLPIMEAPSDVLAASQVDVSLRGSVIVAGTCEDAQVLQVGAELPLRGLVLGSMPASLLPVAAQMRYPILVIDGFGSTAMNRAAFKLLTSNAKREVTVNAGAYERASGARPEMIIPLPVTQEPEPAPEAVPFAADQQVRIYSYPRTGALGTILHILPGLTLLPSGLKAAAAEVRTEEGDQIVIPLANLDVVG